MIGPWLAGHRLVIACIYWLRHKVRMQNRNITKTLRTLSVKLLTRTSLQSWKWSLSTIQPPVHSHRHASELVSRSSIVQSAIIGWEQASPRSQPPQTSTPHSVKIQVSLSLRRAPKRAGSKRVLTRVCEVWNSRPSKRRESTIGCGSQPTTPNLASVRV